MIEALAVGASGAHLSEFSSWPVWVTADFALLARVRAALTGEREGSR